jgi:cell wall-associated NlpC family hydrolase
MGRPISPAVNIICASPSPPDIVKGGFLSQDKFPMKASFIPHLAALLLVALPVSGARGDETTGTESALTRNAVSSAPPPQAPSRVATLAVADLREYELQSPEVKRLLARALTLTTLDLDYKYGSSDPKNGGMDCSGTVYYLLNEAGLKDVPRDAGGMYKWVWTQGRFRAVTSSHPDTFELALLKPGDLLFWTGTYEVDRDPPITHVMIYLGINRQSGRRVMVGASEGRPFDGKSRYGVSVFDFTMPGPRKPSATVPETSPATDPQARFIGYGAVPGLEEIDASEAARK